MIKRNLGSGSRVIHPSRSARTTSDVQKATSRVELHAQRRSSCGRDELGNVSSPQVTDKDLTQNSWIRSKSSPHVKSGTVPARNSFRPKACRQRNEFWINWRLALCRRTSHREEEHTNDESMSPHVSSFDPIYEHSRVAPIDRYYTAGDGQDLSSVRARAGSVVAASPRPSLRRRSRFFLTFLSAQASIVFVAFVAPRKDARATGNRTVVQLPLRIRLPTHFVLPKDGASFLWRP